MKLGSGAGGILSEMACWRGHGKVVATFLLAVTLVSGSASAACRLAVLGDSLTAGHGVPLPQAFPAQLERALTARGLACAVADAGVSGDTAAGGASRIGWVLADHPSHLLVELGANDGLRALPTQQMEDNLSAIVQTAQAAGVRVMLAGMLAPPNLGKDYGDRFAQVFRRVADRYAVPLYPFFLDGVVGRPELVQPDGLHPNPAGVAVIVERIVGPVHGWLTATP